MKSLFAGLVLAGLSLTTLLAYDYGNPTDEEQLMLELINRARANPGAEASRIGISLNQGLPGGTISNTPKAPLALEEALSDAAAFHSQWMLNTNTFSHTGEAGSSPSQRIEAAGYPLTGSWNTAENIVWRGSSAAIDPVAFTHTLHEDLFKSSDHRPNIFSETYDQIGLGIVEGKFREGKNWNALMGTQDYASSDGSPSPDGPLVLGVVFSDNNGNQFYDPGEGLGGVSVSISPGGTSTTTSPSGGYAIPLGGISGALNVTFSGGGVDAPTQKSTTVASQNVKVDLITAAAPLPAVATPNISPNGGSFTRKTKVTLTCATAGATIRYTTNGSEPTESSKKYKRRFTVRKDTVVKAKAFKSGSPDSATATATFTKD